MTKNALTGTSSEIFTRFIKLAILSIAKMVVDHLLKDQTNHVFKKNPP